MLRLGARAPNFILPDAEGRDVVLEDFRGSWVLLFFYPADFTRVCTKEVCAFRDDYEQFRQRNVRLVGINFQPPEKHKRFAERHRLAFPLLWDRRKSICRRYGVLGLWGMYCKRAYYLVDPDGRIAYAHVEAFPFLKRSNEELLAAIERCQAEALARREGRRKKREEASEGGAA